jgi:hypothetical protein
MRSLILAHIRSSFGVCCKLVFTSAFDIAGLIFWNPSEDFSEQKFYRGVLCSVDFLTGEFYLDVPLTASGFLPAGLSDADAWEYVFSFADFLLASEVFVVDA